MQGKRLKKSFTGHSSAFSVEDALADAVAQAIADEGTYPDEMVEFEVLGLRGRAGGIAGFRDLWVEIAVLPPGEP